MQLVCVRCPIVSAIRDKLLLVENILKSMMNMMSEQEDTSYESQVISAKSCT